MKSNRSNAVVSFILLAGALGLSACSHSYGLHRRDEAAMLNDSPAISPWMGPVPDEMVGPGDRFDAREPGRLDGREHGDEN
jgi:hypothetical protein